MKKYVIWDGLWVRYVKYETTIKEDADKYAAKLNQNQSETRFIVTTFKS